MAWLKKYAKLAAYLLVTATLVAALQFQQQHTTQTLYENSVAACGRGNLIRSVVYANTLQAARLQPRASYATQLKTLGSVPGFNTEDGTVNCVAVIPKP